MDNKVYLKETILFDGKNYYESADIIIDHGIISDIIINETKTNNKQHFIMPGFIDTHTHTNSEKQLDNLKKCGVLCTCSVVASNEIKNIKYKTKAYSSYSMALGGITDVKSYVENEIKNNADYIKVIIEDKPRMSLFKIKQEVLCDIVKYSHQYNKKVAVHAVTVEDEQMAVNAGVDILIHIPLKEVIPDDLIKQIKEKQIAVIPTLVMMKAFSKLWIMGYKKEDFEASKKSVNKLFQNNIPILVGTDSNNSIFAPSIKFGKSIFDEMKLLREAGVPNNVILEGATSNASDVFGISNVGTITKGKKANLLVINGNPVQKIDDICNIESIYIDGLKI